MRCSLILGAFHGISLCPDKDSAASLSSPTLANNVAECAARGSASRPILCAAIFAAVRERAALCSSSQVLWTLVHVSLQARLHGLEGKDISSGSDGDALHVAAPLSFEELGSPARAAISGYARQL